MLDLTKIIVVGDKVLIKPEENLHKTNSGLYLPPGVSEREQVRGGYVLKVGPGYAVASQNDDEPWKDSNDVQYIPLQAEEGDFALFTRKSAIEIEIEGEKLLIVPHAAILILFRDNELFNF